MYYGGIQGPVGLNNYNSLFSTNGFGTSSNGANNILDPASMINNITSSYLGMSGTSGWGSPSPGLLSNPFMPSGNSLWSMPSAYGYNPMTMMPLGYGSAPNTFGYNPYLAYDPLSAALLGYSMPQQGFQQPMMQQPIQWQDILTQLATYFQSQPQQSPAQPPVVAAAPAAILADASQVAVASPQAPLRSADDIAAQLQLAPVRSLPAPAPAPSFSTAWHTPSGVTPPARWARSAPSGGNVFAATTPPAPAPVPSPAPMMPPPPPPSQSGGLPFGLGSANNWLGDVRQTITQNLPFNITLPNVGKADNKGSQKGNGDKNHDGPAWGNPFGGGFGPGKAWGKGGKH